MQLCYRNNIHQLCNKSVGNSLLATEIVKVLLDAWDAVTVFSVLCEEENDGHVAVSDVDGDEKTNCGLKWISND